MTHHVITQTAPAKQTACCCCGDKSARPLTPAQNAAILQFEPDQANIPKCEAAHDTPGAVAPCGVRLSTSTSHKQAVRLCCPTYPETEPTRMTPNQRTKAHKVSRASCHIHTTTNRQPSCSTSKPDGSVHNAHGSYMPARQRFCCHNRPTIPQSTMQYPPRTRLRS